MEQAGDGCGRGSWKIAEEAVAAMADLLEAGDREGVGRLFEPEDTSMEDLSQTHEMVRPSSQSLTLQREPARNS